MNSVAVLNDDGAIIANMSASELLGISQENLSYLKEPVLQFLEKVSGCRFEINVEREGEKPLSPITCEPEDDLKDVIKKMLEYGIHRVWITDKQKRPLGVNTLTDILRQLMIGVTTSQ